MTSIKSKLSNYKSFVKNKHLVEIIDKIISSYPFSFVNLEKLRREVDLLDELFWIKNEEGRYLLVNDKFALNFHLTPSQLEGKLVDKFLPAYLIDFNKAIDEYIKESRNVFIIEGFPLLGVASREDYQIIEIPIPGAENNLLALIGVAQKVDSREEKINDLYSSLNLLKDFIKNYLLINSENNITDVSEEFCKNFSLVKKELLGKNYNSDKSGLPVLLGNAIENFIKSGEDARLTNINISDIINKEFKLHLIKGKDGEKLILLEVINLLENTQFVPDGDDKFYDRIIQNNTEPSFIYDKEDLRFLKVNDAALKLYGYRKDEFLQLDITDLYTPEDIQTLLQTSEEKFKEGVYSKPQRQTRKDGSNIFVEINRTGINYNDKQAYLNIVKSVMEKLNLEKESQHFKAAFSSTDNLIFITDKEGFIKEVNSPVVEVLGYSGKSLIETSLTSLLIDSDRGKINSSVFQSGLKEKLRFDTSLKKAGNEFLKVKLTANPIFNYNGEIEIYNIICCIQENVKEIIKEVIREVPIEIIREEKFNSSNIPEINFLSNIFHDLLTPINVILSFTQELTGDIEQPSSEQKEALEIINQNRENLLSKMNQVIEFIQTENGKFEFNLSSVKIIDIIEDVKKEIDEKNFLQDGEIAFGKISSSLEVITDKQKLQRFFVLLIKVITKITGEKKIYMSAFPLNEKYFSIGLKDHYNTSSENFLEKISLFFSGDLKIVKEQGISFFTFKLCKNLLNLLNGKFEISTEKDKKEAMFVFPVKFEKEIGEKEIIEKEVEERDELKDSESLMNAEKIDHKKVEEKEPVSEMLNQQMSIDLSQMSCLYIEDQVDSQMLFSMQMNDLKEISFAVSLEQSIPILNNKKFDFIVIDINLQGDYNGLDILKIIRTMTDYQNVPVIAVTAYLLPVNNELYIQAGFSDFISKPILRENLLASLERTLIQQT